MIQSFSSRFNFEKFSVHGKWLIKKIMLFVVKMFLTTKIKRETRGTVWHKPVPDLQLCYCPKFLWFVLTFCEEFTVWVGFWLCILPKTMNKLISTKIRVFNSLVGPSESAKSQVIYNWFKNGTFQPKLDKIYSFYQHSQAFYDVMQKEVENLEFFRGVNKKELQLLKVNTPPVINHFLWYEAVCPRSCFCVQQKFDYPVCYKAGTSKVSTFTKCHVSNWIA